MTGILKCAEHRAKQFLQRHLQHARRVHESKENKRDTEEFVKEATATLGAKVTLKKRDSAEVCKK